MNESDSSDEEIIWGENSEEEEEKSFEFKSNNDDEDNNENALVTMTMDTSLLSNNEEKYDSLERDTWIADSGASTHMCNSDEGMFDCSPTPNQYIKVGNGNRLPIL